MNISDELNDINMKSLTNDSTQNVNEDINKLQLAFTDVKDQVDSLEKSLEKMPNIYEIRKMQNQIQAISDNNPNTPVDDFRYRGTEDQLVTKSAKIIGDGLFKNEQQSLVLADYTDSFPSKYALCQNIDREEVGVVYFRDACTSSSEDGTPAVEPPNIMSTKQVRSTSTHVRMRLEKKLSDLFIGGSSTIMPWVNENLKQSFGMDIDKRFFARPNDLDDNIDDYRTRPGVQSIFTGIVDANRIRVECAAFRDSFVQYLIEMKVKLFSRETMKTDDVVWVMSPRMHGAIHRVRDRNGNFIFDSKIFGHDVLVHNCLTKFDASEASSEDFIILTDFKQCYAYFEQSDIECREGHNAHMREREYYLHKSCAGTVFNKQAIQYLHVYNVQAEGIVLNSDDSNNSGNNNGDNDNSGNTESHQ